MGLFGPKFKNDDKLFLSLKDFYETIGKLLTEDKYISRKEYIRFCNEKANDFDNVITLRNNNTLNYWCKNTKSDPSLIDKFIYSYQNIQSIIEKHNKQFMERHLAKDKEYLDKILKNDDPNIILDEDQRNVVLNDEDHVLVVAGAGAGKTTTLEAKAKYLVDKQHVDPKRILVVSFTKKATKELQERFDKIKIPAIISTFHSIGNTLINSATGKHTIVTPGFMFDVLKKYLETQLEDAEFIKKIMLFFASYLDMPFDCDKSVELYKKLLENADFTTMKNDLDNYKQTLTKNKVTIRSERVKSVQECQIANFLFINGIEYEYEPLYPYCMPGTSKPYTPDFLIRQGDHVAYLEHYGINENGTNWRFDKQELELYKKHIKDKELLHKSHQTELLHTFSSYDDKRDLTYHLRQELTKHGFICRQINNEQIYRELAQTAEDRYFIKLIQLICNFINRFKTNNYHLERFSDFQSVANINDDQRTLLFLDIARQCYLKYENALEEKGAIDFEDMINNAADILDQKIQRGEKLPFDYIFIDEYQAISFQRFNLAEKLSKCCDAKILAVGDDWQSIYRFSGSDITLFTDFEKIMGYASILYLTNTHRNSQELIDMAGSFVMKNDLQKKKLLKSPKHIKDPVIIMSYNDNYSKSAIQLDPKESPYYRLGEAIEASLDHIHNEFGDDKSVLLLGRYNFDGKNLSRLRDLFLCTEDNRIRSKKYPKMKINFMTAHSSKGLGADNVIIINGKDDILGFPSKIEDDPVMKLVLKQAKEIDYAEERRLFYVAMTRTKNRVYMIVPKNKPSQFVLEIKDSFTNIVLNGPALVSNRLEDYRYKCPHCGYPLQVKKRKLNSSYGEMTLYVCTNDPEVCGFVTNDYSGGKMSIQKCPQCLNGYLIVKKIKDDRGNDTGRRMLGCTNYNGDKGCKYTIQQENFSPSWEKVSRNNNNYIENGIKLPIDKCVLAGYPIMDLLKIYKYVVGKLSVEKHFKFNVYSLTDFLIGKKNKAIQMYHLDEDKAFGRFHKDQIKLLMAIASSLIELGFFRITEPQYKSIELNDMPITEEFARQVFELFRF